MKSLCLDISSTESHYVYGQLCVVCTLSLCVCGRMCVCVCVCVYVCLTMCKKTLGDSVSSSVTPFMQKNNPPVRCQMSKNWLHPFLKVQKAPIPPPKTSMVQKTSSTISYAKRSLHTHQPHPYPTPLLPGSFSHELSLTLWGLR